MSRSARVSLDKLRRAKTRNYRFTETRTDHQLRLSAEGRRGPKCRRAPRTAQSEACEEWQTSPRGKSTLRQSRARGFADCNRDASLRPQDASFQRCETLVDRYMDGRVHCDASLSAEIGSRPAPPYKNRRRVLLGPARMLLGPLASPGEFFSKASLAFCSS